MKWLFKRAHVCYFNKPLVSQYRSFNVRRIVFECRCGKRKQLDEYREFGHPFSIQTNLLITNKEMNLIEKGFSFMYLCAIHIKTQIL